jgi:SNF2 family DNA or RNA helicase
MIYKAEPYQKHSTAHIEKYPGTGLFLEMGLGKTVATLTAIVNMFKAKTIKKVLIIAPLSVARDTWTDEINKWDHTKHLKVSKILGLAKQRSAAIKADADIYTINCENVPWLIAECQNNWPWDYVVIDEISKFKSAKSRRFKSLRMILPRINKVTGLTGTPRPNSLLDLWSQLFLLDKGERLGKTLGHYRSTYFKPDKQNGHIIYSYKIKKEDPGSLLGEEIYAAEIYDKISDICISMRAKDYITLPDKIIRTKEITLDQVTLDKYKAFEKDLIMEMADKEITVANAAVLTGKLLQFSNGAIYDDERNWHELHNAKLDALEDIVEDAQGSPVLILYNYKHDIARIQKRLKGYVPRLLKTSQDMEDWNAGKIKVAAAHPKSVGHGLNLQAGGNIIIWFGPQWSLELNDQANARLHRRGQKQAVIIHYLICKNTLDKDVIESLHNKRSGQNGAMKALKAKIDYYKNI